MIRLILTFHFLDSDQVSWILLSESTSSLRGPLGWAAVFFIISPIVLCIAQNPENGGISSVIDRVGVGQRFLVSDEPQTQITSQESVNILAGKVGHKEIHLNLPYWLAHAVAFMMEFSYRTLNKYHRPLLTRYAVSWLGNSVVYDTTRLKSLGWTQRHSIQQGIEIALKYIPAKEA